MGPCGIFDQMFEKQKEIVLAPLNLIKEVSVNFGDNGKELATVSITIPADIARIMINDPNHYVGGLILADLKTYIEMESLLASQEKQHDNSKKIIYPPGQRSHDEGRSFIHRKKRG
jgi:hypothetical protein